MPEFIKDKRSRTYIIIAVIILIAVAAIVFFALRKNKETKVTENSNPVGTVNADPTANEPQQAPQYLRFYESLDTMKLGSDLTVLSMAFRQLGPLIDQWMKKADLKPEHVGKDHQEFLLNGMEIRNNPQGVNNSKFVKGAMYTLANLMDSISNRTGLNQQQNLEAMHKIADQMKENVPPYNQQTEIKNYFAHVHAIVKVMNANNFVPGKSAQ